MISVKTKDKTSINLTKTLCRIVKGCAFYVNRECVHVRDCIVDIGANFDSGTFLIKGAAHVETSVNKCACVFELSHIHIPYRRRFIKLQTYV